MEWTETNKVIEEFATTIRDDWRVLMENDRYAASRLKFIPFTIKNDNQIYRITFSVVDYFWYWNYGRRPGKMPPRAPILNWIKKYNIIPKPYTLPNGKQRIPSLESLAFLIQRSIGRNGTKGRKLWEPFLDDLVERYQIKIQEAVAKDIANNIESELD